MHGLPRQANFKDQLKAVGAHSHIPSLIIVVAVMLPTCRLVWQRCCDVGCYFSLSKSGMLDEHLSSFCASLRGGNSAIPATGGVRCSSDDFEDDVGMGSISFEQPSGGTASVEQTSRHVFFRLRGVKLANQKLMKSDTGLGVRFNSGFETCKTQSIVVHMYKHVFSFSGTFKKRCTFCLTIAMLFGRTCVLNSRVNVSP